MIGTITSQKVIEEGIISVMYHKAANIDWTIRANQPDNVLLRKGKGLCLLIDVATPDDANVSGK